MRVCICSISSLVKLVLISFISNQHTLKHNTLFLSTILRCQSQYSMNLIVTRVTLKRGVIIQISIFISSKFEFNQMLLTHRDRILEQVHQTFLFVF